MNNVFFVYILTNKKHSVLYTGVTNNLIKRVRSMMLKALPDMFHYLDDKLIPFSTNSLEGYFSRVKWGYRNHRGLAVHKRGLAVHKRINYFKWHTFFAIMPAMTG